MLAAAVLSSPSPEAAHAALKESTPKSGAHLSDPPGRLSISFTEPPTGDARLEVTDGCARNVLEDLTVSGDSIRGALAAGQAGRWKVSYSVISAVDGHQTGGRFSFLVHGQRDCSGTGTQAAPPPTSSTSDGSDFPIVPFALGGLVVIGLAAAARVLSHRGRA